MSLFKKALDTTTPAKAKGPGKKQLIIKDNELAEKASELADINRQIDALKATAAGLDEEVRSESKKAFLKEYKDAGKYPGSVEVVFQGDKATNKAQMLFVPVDKYLTIDKDRAQELRNIINEEIVSEKITWELDPELVEKHGDEISKLIEKSTKISNEDKEKLITGKVKYSIKKGSISEILTILPNSKEIHSIEGIIEEIRPIFQSKNLKTL